MQVPATGALCAAISRARRIHVSDVLALRHSLMGKPRPSHHDAASIAGLAAQNFPACEQWRPFFIETISAYLIDGAAPRGELTEENAAWLIARCEDGLDEALAFELAATVVQRAANCPSELMRYLLARLNDLSAQVQQGMARDEEKAALDAARMALRTAGLAGRLYVPRDPPAPASAAA
ncbi:MAG: hypothetical protein ACK4MV_20915 [Beijerinckiaceae bacterium]